MTSDSSNHTHNFISRYPSSIVVGNGSLLPVTSTGTATLPGPFSLNNVLVSPSLIKNLISVRQFTSDNNCSVEFDPAGCSVKDLESRRVLVRCNSAGPLYPLRLPAAAAFIVGAPSPWHRRLGHPGHEIMTKLSSVIPSCNKELSTSLCHACQLGRHVRLPFTSSTSRASNNFDLIHCDQLLVSRATSIIWSFSMIARTTCGLFLCA